ncbi:MAG: hypothetical protein HFJ38_04340 [Bacilli bacterium]|nr:hypothetical protein [Bacilli bacterium]
MDIVDFYLEDLKMKFKKINSNKYYLSYSGGKDSHLLYWFIKEYAKIDGIVIVGINTYMEHQEIRDRIYKNSDIVLLPAINPIQIKEKYGIPCFSKSQDDFIDRYQRGCRKDYLMDRIYGKTFIGRNGKTYKSAFNLSKIAREKLLSGELHKISPKCCTYLKKKPAIKFEKETGKKAILGVKSNESSLRKAQYTSCFSKDGRFTPLWDLSDELEDKIYEKYNIELPKIYNYIKRTRLCTVVLMEVISTIQKKNLHY